MLAFIFIHHHAISMFQGPRCAARFKYYGVTSEFVDSYLHRGACAQTWIEKNQCHCLACQGRFFVLSAFKAKSRFDELVKIIARHTDGVDEVRSHVLLSLLKDLSQCANE